ncbi:MAG: DUF3871 family protein [Bacteroidetes bacterium]|nr:DUF3871 family protein [Bacteroidota bacterium]
MEQLVASANQTTGIDEAANTSSFIEANTISSTLEEIRNRHIIPVFTKDNETAISHTEFLETTLDIAKDYFHGMSVTNPVIRLSHPVKGRIPEARNKQAKDLLDHEKSLYYERMAFMFEVPEISREINGNKLSLSIGGVKAYNEDNLYNKKGSTEHFKIFIGFQNKVCLNLKIWTDGLKDDVRVIDLDGLGKNIRQLITGYDAEAQILQMQEWTNYHLTEHQFAQLIGKAKLYQFLGTQERKQLPPFQFLDCHLSTIAKDYYSNESFCRDQDGNINLWNLYNLFTGANKSSYIDKFLERGLNASEFITSLNQAIKHKEDFWLLN